ncbi:DUF3667 domain-containing protein [Polaribacter sp. ALD11]|uniref:DUF3667 domain-containing protein n=1 Tax=Polaribacter sp. ALD11 TaxID=2058137 RepID=UPI0012FE6401|nr:DUF3667 domain-containing protein [Polaribacter sp. ALD11]
MFSFDTKFWRTLIPLLINPGKVTKDYREGKRSRYSNPFRFYITASILFFLVLGFSKNYNKYQNLTKENIQKELSYKDALDNSEIKPDSIKKLVEKEFDKSFYFGLSDKKKKEILDTIEEEAKDSTKRKEITENKLSFEGTRLGLFLKHQKEHPKAATNDALDSLNYPKNLKNRFLYERSKTMSQVFNDTNSADKFLSEALSYGSVSLFIFLPLFTLFLKLFYIRRKYTYVDHLIFVFHTQTVFFMLLTIFTIVELFVNTEDLWIFLILFLVYLFLAMKKFYQQGIFKTFIKFLMLNFVYLIMGILGILLVAIISFALY